MTTNGAPDLVLTRGRVYTMDAARSWAEAVAVRAGRITAVGSSAEIEALRGPETHVVDLHGRMLLPGFQDAHLHPTSGGLMQVQCDLHGTTTREQSLERIARYAEAHPEQEWILGGGWGMDAFPGGTPSKSDLDAIVPGPVLLTNRDGHGAWVNSKALELAGISRETADPKDGRIERDERPVSLPGLFRRARWASSSAWCRRRPPRSGSRRSSSPRRICTASESPRFRMRWSCRRRSTPTERWRIATS